MATLVFTDGTRKVVDYNTATRIKQIKDGKVSPEFIKPEQAAYANQVSTIEFMDLPKVTSFGSTRENCLCRHCVARREANRPLGL